MCGIGLVITNEKGKINSLCEKINNSQFKRGPDSQKYVVFEKIGICHQRLEIVGLGKEFNQPYFYGDYTISFNGEIFNFKDLAQEYSLSKNASKSDTACLIELINIMGLERTISLIDGMYSFGIYDKKKKKVRICTDNFGIKQLYFYESKNLLIIASTVNSIKECLINQKIDFSPNEKTIFWQESFNGSPPLQTHIKEIKQLNKLFIHEIDLSQKDTFYKIKSYPKIKYNFSKSDNSLKNNLSQASIAEVEKGLLLSGGIDSTCLLCCLKEQKKSLESYIVDNKASHALGFSSQEISNAAKYSESMRIKKNIIDEDKINSKDLENVFKIIDIPAEVTGALALYLICKNIKEKNSKIRVLLSGMGADEIFFGYRGHFLALVISLIPSQLYSLLNSGIKLLTKIIPDSYISWLRRITVINNVLSSENIFKDAALHSFTKLSPMALNEWRWAYPIKEYKRLFNLPKLYYQRCFDYFLSQLHLPAYDRVSMFYSIELRVPFLQNRIKDSNSIKNFFDLALKSIYRKKRLKKIIKKELKTNYKSITKSGFGAYPIMFSSDAFTYINKLIEFGNKSGWINEKPNSKSSMNLRLFFHLVNKAHFVYLLKNMKNS